MARGRRLLAGLAALCVLASGCGSITRAAGLSTPGGNPDPATAIALSVLSDTIYLVDPATGRADALVTGLAGFQSGYAAWGPGHRYLAYGDRGIRILDPKTRRAELLAPGQTVSMPAPSTKGKTLAYGDGTGTWVTPVAKADPAPIPLPEELDGFAYDWLGGSGIVFQGLRLDCANPEGCISTDTSDIWLVHADGTGLTQLTTTQDALDPKWSPDGKSILYVRSSTTKSFGSQLWAMRLDGTAPHRLIPAKNVVAADWSPDGGRLVVIRALSLTQSLQIWVGSSGGAGLHRIGAGIGGIDATVDW